MIALDANGADHGPEAAAEGARIAGLEVELFGPPLPAIGNDEEPTRAVRSRPDASIGQAARAVADGRCNALVSPGPPRPSYARFARRSAPVPSPRPAGS